MNSISATVSRTGKTWAKNNLHHIESLPHPDSEWVANETEIKTQLIWRLRNQGFINKIGSRLDDDYQHKNLYETTESGFELVCELIDKRDNTEGLLPCDHDGFRNIGDGKLQCLEPTCEEIHDKEAIR